MTYVAKASHFAKRLSKPVTMTATKPALRGHSLSTKEWAERKYRHVSASLPFFLDHTIPPLHKLHTPIYTQLPLNDFNAVCLSDIEKERESSSRKGTELLWKCTFISMQFPRVLTHDGTPEIDMIAVDSRPPASF